MEEVEKTKSHKLSHHDKNIPEYPRINGKLQSLFGIQSRSIFYLNKLFHELYSNSFARNAVTPKKIHHLILNFFINEYYPVVSRNIKLDNHTMAIIMGGVAFNMNIPTKMQNSLGLETDDIDIKIYTTDNITTDNHKNTLSRSLSILRFVNIIICLFLKQVIGELIEFTNTMFEPTMIIKKYSGIKNKVYTMKNSMTNSLKDSTNTSKKSGKKSGKQSAKKSTKKQIGGNHNKDKKLKLIKNKQMRFGFLKSAKLIIELKKSSDESHKYVTFEKIDVTQMSFDETYNIIMSKLNNPDIMITTKLNYNVRYIKPFIMPKMYYKYVFSDSSIISPGVHNPTFFSYYFMNNRKQIDIPINRLLKQKINVFDIIETQNCNNNCRYVSIKVLKVDLCVMLSYAELLEYEDIDAKNIVVPISAIYKYYKYLIKFIHLYIIKNFYNKEFVAATKKLINLIVQTLKDKTSLEGETAPLNLQYKKILNDFHQAFFIKKTMFPEYKILKDIVNDYEHIVYFINRSRALFKTLDDEKGSVGETIESLSIQIANKEVIHEKSTGKSKLEDMNDANDISDTPDTPDIPDTPNIKDTIGGSRTSRKSRIILMDRYSYEDNELDTKQTHRQEKKIVLEKLYEMFTNEIKFLNKISEIRK